MLVLQQLLGTETSISIPILMIGSMTSPTLVLEYTLITDVRKVSRPEAHSSDLV